MVYNYTKRLNLIPLCGGNMMIKKEQAGFTMIELILVVVIISVFAAVAIPRFTENQASAIAAADSQNIAIIQKQAELYNINNGSYPGFLTDTDFNNETYFANGIPTSPTGSDYLIDPTTGVVSLGP